MKKPELLAPAGNMESLIAAIEAGCDAVYIGGKHFGARAFANNFDKQELQEAVNICHLYGVKLYVTVNTLIYESEVDECLNYIKYLHKIGIDAVIMQDLGMIDLVRKTLPNMEIHASTQAHIHNVEGAKFIEKLGLPRTVLARETSIEEIKKIKENTNLELEVFVHGALCISYSGQCLMSYLIGGRSGNRGACAGSCRLQYDLVDKNGIKVNKDKYLLSTKDLNSLENIGTLIDMGIDSFKIEGRMKSPHYVYTVVNLYRKAIDSYCRFKEVRINPKELDELKRIFNREYTKGFLFDEDNNNLVNQYRPNHLGVNIGVVNNYNKGIVTIKLSDNLTIGDGIRILGEKDTGFSVTTMFKNNKKVTNAKKGDIVTFKIDDEVTINSSVLKTTDVLLMQKIDKKIKDKKRKVNIKMQIKLKIGEPIKLKIKDEQNVIILTYGKVEEALNAPITREKVIEQLSKLGNTIYNLEDIIIKMDKNIFVNLKDLNEIRRQGIELLNEKRLEVKPYIEGEYSIDLPDFKKEQNLNIKISSLENYEKIKNLNLKNIYIDDIDLYKKIDDDRKVFLLPRVISDYQECNFKKQVEELGSINYYKDYQTGPFLNVTNSYTLAFLHSMSASKVTLSYELAYDQVEELITNYIKRYNKLPNTEVIVFGRIEAMISKFNLLNKYNVKGEYYLRDRFGNNYPIIIKNDKMVIYNYKNKIDLENYYNIGVNNIRLDMFNNKDIDDIKNIIKNY